MKTEIVTVNGVQIECPYKKDQHYVAIRPICEALGIDYRKQFERIKGDRKLSQLVTHTVTNSIKDKKNYEMVSLPLKYVFGWLFSIDETKVNAKAQSTFAKYKDDCYEVLYDHFYGLMAKRKNLLYEKSEIRKQIEAIEEVLKDNEDYQKLVDLHAAQMRMGKDLKNVDSQQLSLF
jgi:hypothetical protein